MKVFQVWIAFVGLYACSASPPSLNPFGYLPVTRVEGCSAWGENQPVLMGPELSANLLSQLTVGEIGPRRCWSKHSDGTLELEVGEFCNPDLFAYFHEDGGEWKLLRVDANPIVICDERRS